jgi:hypothetical protein
MITIFRVGPAPSRLLLGLFALNYFPLLGSFINKSQKFLAHFTCPTADHIGLCNVHLVNYIGSLSPGIA